MIIVFENLGTASFGSFVLVLSPEQCLRMDGVSLPDSIEFITFGECALAATATSESEGPIFSVATNAGIDST